THHPWCPSSASRTRVLRDNAGFGLFGAAELANAVESLREGPRSATAGESLFCSETLIERRSPPGVFEGVGLGAVNGGNHIIMGFLRLGRSDQRHGTIVTDLRAFFVPDGAATFLTRAGRWRDQRWYTAPATWRLG